VLPSYSLHLNTPCDDLFAEFGSIAALLPRLRLTAGAAAGDFSAAAVALLLLPPHIPLLPPPTSKAQVLARQQQLQGRGHLHCRYCLCRTSPATTRSSTCSTRGRPSPLPFAVDGARAAVGSSSTAGKTPRIVRHSLYPSTPPHSLADSVAGAAIVHQLALYHSCSSSTHPPPPPPGSLSAFPSPLVPPR
jgi:hypothetical protein